MRSRAHSSLCIIRAIAKIASSRGECLGLVVGSYSGRGRDSDSGRDSGVKNNRFRV